MYVNTFIEESEVRFPSLPSEAVVSFDDKDYIFIFEKEKEEAGMQFTEYKMVEIKKGISASGYTEISVPDGIDIKESKVVIKGAYNLLSAKKNAGEMAC
jgi:cobalt-zinc-cadmium efflux system membrane fusion protein